MGIIMLIGKITPMHVMYRIEEKTIGPIDIIILPEVANEGFYDQRNLNTMGIYTSLLAPGRVHQDVIFVYINIYIYKY